MATQAQTVDIPKRLPLVVAPSNRGTVTSTDAKIVNVYAEKHGDDFWLSKRPGLETSFENTGSGYGLFQWRGSVYSIFGNKLYKDNAAVSGTVNTAGGVYKFDQSLGATPRLVLGNGVKGYTYETSGGLAEITDAQFPAAFVKGWAYLDATTYVMTAAANIQGSDIANNDPTAWDALNTIQAYIVPDQGVGLAKQLVYVVAFKQESVEIFYDATTTPCALGRVQGAKVSYGCASADSIQEIDGMLFWLATTKGGSLSVMKLDNLRASTISTEAIERLMTGLDLTTVFSWTYNSRGHKFYVLTSKVSNLTLAYDLTGPSESQWAQWTDVDGNYVPIVASATLGQIHYVQHETNGVLYTMGMDKLTDDGDFITCDIVTPNFDGGVRRRKQMNRLEILADQTPGSTLQIRKSDDDYQHWSNWRTVDLGTKSPFLSDCGTFTRRAHWFRHSANTAFRIQAAEMQLDIGTL